LKHGEIVSFLWDVANLIRDTFKRGKYQDVILPLTVLRRLDSVLKDTKPAVLKAEAKYKAKGLDNRDGQLRKASGFAFYNTSKFDFDRLLADPNNLAANLRKYIAGFSPNMREVVEKFDFDNTISKLDEAGLLYQVLQQFNDPKVNLHPDNVLNDEMGTLFEELIRKFNEALNENPGEHFTPRDVVHLMVDLLLAGDKKQIRTPNVTLTVYDPCCGSGGMLTIAKEHITLGVRKALSERDPEAPPCLNSKGEPEHDSELRDTESVPLFESIEAFFEREVRPHVPDAWIDRNKCDEKDGEVGIVGYEINFNRYFYRYTPPRELADIERDIRGIEKGIVRMLAEVTGSGATQ